MKTVCVIGLGYIGLPTASLLATKGFSVLGVDVNKATVDTINSGRPHIDSEPDLDVLVRSAVHSGNLKASLSPKEADAFIIAVPTPFKAGHTPDLSFIETAVEAMAPCLKSGNLVVLESTSPVGTTELIGERLRKARPDLTVPSPNLEPTERMSPKKRIYLAHCPERVLPGQIIHELVNNDRIIGGVDTASAECARSLYQQFVIGKIFLTDARTAEMAKLTENAYRDVNIAFANEISVICRKFGIDAWKLIELANRHPRVKILQPGPGVGGHCIAVDPWFIVHSTPDSARLIRTAREVNDRQPQEVVSLVRKETSDIAKPNIACLGLSYKADVGDLRESPAVSIAQKLASWKRGKIYVVEPHIKTLPPSLAQMSNVSLCGLDEALSKAQVIVLLTNHRVFLDIDRSRMAAKVVIDTRGAWR